MRVTLFPSNIGRNMADLRNTVEEQRPREILRRIIPRRLGESTRGSEAFSHSIRSNLYSIPDFSHLIDTHSDRLSNLLEVEGRENTREGDQVLAYLTLQIPQEAITAGTKGSDDSIVKEIGAFCLGRGQDHGASRKGWHP